MQIQEGKKEERVEAVEKKGRRWRRRDQLEERERPRSGEAGRGRLDKTGDEELLDGHVGSKPR